MKKVLLFLIVSLLTIQSFSQTVIRSKRDSVVYTPVSLMDRMVGELTQCDSIRTEFIKMRLRLDSQERTDNKYLDICRDSLDYLTHEFRRSSGIIQDLNDSITAEHIKLLKLNTKYNKVRSNKRIWTFLAVGAMFTAIGIHLSWKSGPSLD